MKKIIYILTAFAFTTSFGQSDPNFRQNNFNALMLNPAQAGANDYNDVTILGSQSWLGFDGAPRTVTASGNFNLKHNMGFGISGFLDQLGPINASRISADLAYHLKLNEDWTAALGLRAMLSSIYVDLPSLTTTVLNDPYMSTSLVSGTLFDVGFGGLLYSDQYYFGVSMPRVASRNFQNVNMQEFVERKGFISYGGAQFDLTETLQIRPSTVFRYVHSYPLLWDVNAMFTYDGKYDFGLNYQLMNSLGVVLGYELGEQLSFGYAYSFPTSKLNRISFQSHEIVIRIKMFGGEGGFSGGGSSKSPRFFN